MEWHGVTTEMLPQNKGKCKSLSLWTDLGHVQSLSTLNCVDPHNVWGRDGWRFIQNSFLHSPVLLFQCQFLLGGYLSIPVVTVLSPLPFSCLSPKPSIYSSSSWSLSLWSCKCCWYESWFDDWLLIEGWPSCTEWSPQWMSMRRCRRFFWWGQWGL